jgi:hypothetical protein
MKKGLFILAVFVAVGLLLPIYGLARTITLNPTDDATVFSTVPTFNYGAVATLLASKAFSGTQLTGERQAYLKFDLSGLAGINPADVTLVSLHLYVSTTAGGQVEAYHSPDIYSTSSDPWVEGNGSGATVPGITWNNKPSLAGAPLMGTSPNLTPNNAFYTIDLLAGGKSWLAGDLCDHWLSLALVLPASVDTSTTYYFNSMEASGNHPYLEVQVADVPSASYAIVGVGDFNGDTKPDIIWRNTSSGRHLVWYMNGATVTGLVLLDSVSDANWTIGGTGDLNGDTKPDILWRNPFSGQNLVWYMNGATVTGLVLLDSVSDANWTIVGTGDFNGDTKPDILWRNPSSGQNLVWYMNGATVTGTVLLDSVSDANWKIVGTGDFNGDTKPDILWRNNSCGQNLVWYMNGATVTGTVLLDSVSDANWTIVGTGDFNGDTKPDILWRNPVTGQNAIWYMNGITVSGFVLLDSVE